MNNAHKRSKRRDALSHLCAAIKEGNRDNVKDYLHQFKIIFAQSKNQKLSSKEEQNIKDIAFACFNKEIINIINKSFNINWLKINKTFPFYIKKEHRQDIKNKKAIINKLFSWIFDKNNKMLNNEEMQLYGREFLRKSCFVSQEPLQYVNNPLIHFIRNTLLDVIPDNILRQQDKEQIFVNGFHNGMKYLHFKNFDNFKPFIDDFIKLSDETRFQQLMVKELNYFLPNKGYARKATKNNIKVWQHIYSHNDVFKKFWDERWSNNKIQNNKINNKIKMLNKVTSFQDLPFLKEYLKNNKTNNNIMSVVSSLSVPSLFDNDFIEDLYKYTKVSVQDSNKTLLFKKCKLINGNDFILNDSYFNLLNEKQLNVSTLILFLSYKNNYKKYHINGYQKKCSSIFSFILKNSGSHIKDFLAEDFYVKQINKSIQDNPDDIINFCIKSNIATFSYAYKKLDKLRNFQLDSLNIIDIWLFFTKERITFEVINRLVNLSKDFSDTVKKNNSGLNNYLFEKIKNKQEIDEMKRLIITLNVTTEKPNQTKRRKF